MNDSISIIANPLSDNVWHKRILLTGFLFEPHVKENRIFEISFIEAALGSGKEDKTSAIYGSNKVFVIMILPVKVRNLFCQCFIVL